MNDQTLSSAAILYGTLLPRHLNPMVDAVSTPLAGPVPIWKSADDRFLRCKDVVRVFDPSHPRHLRKGLIVHIAALLAPRRRLYEVLFERSPEDSEQFDADRLQMLGQVIPGEELWTEDDHGIFRGCRSSGHDGQGHRLYCLSPEDDPEHISQYPLDQVYRI